MADHLQHGPAHAKGVNGANPQQHEAHVADGTAGDAPFDAIVLGGSVCEVPQSLLQQLSIGGHLIAIVGTEPVMCATLFTRTADANWHSKALWDTTAPRLQGFAEPTRFHF
jgi:protein-L-isoaspartate(D-aspartate) O-methyltransferase